MRSTIGMTEKNSGRSANWRVWIIVAAVAGGVAALLAGGVSWRAALAQSGTWTHCADEGATCTFEGTKYVRYGANNTYVYATFTGSVQCSNTVFGDPVPGTHKSCDYENGPPTPGDWTSCADEGKFCAFTGTLRVRYGANGTYSYNYFTGGVQCSNDVFGDPVPGTGKSCDTQNPPPPPSPPPTPSPTGTPDYSKVNDFLNGQRHILRTDDLAVFTGSVSTQSQLSILQTSDSDIQNASDPIAFGDESIQFFYTQSGRMFNLPADVIVSFVGGQSNNRPRISIYNPVTKTTANYDLENGYGDPVIDDLKMGDFNLDGYADLMLSYGFSGSSEWRLKIVVPNDVNNFDAPVGFGPEFYVGGTTFVSTAISDFNGDGQSEIAGLLQSPSGGLTLNIYTVNPQTLGITHASALDLTIGEASPSNPLTHFSMASGKFTAAPHDQLVVAYATDNQTVKFKIIDFDASLQPQEKTTTNTVDIPRPGGIVSVKTGRFDWNSQYDQIAFMFALQGQSSSEGTRTKYLAILQVDPASLSITTPFPISSSSVNVYDFSQQDCAFDFTVGNFDRQQPDPTNPSNTERNPDLQLALLFGSCGNGSKNVDVLNVDPQNNFKVTLTPASINQPFQLPDSYNQFTDLQLVAGDTQGRSFLLGPGQKITINDYELPSVITAMPPMHVDFVAPSGQNGQKTNPTVLNLSAVPDSFWAKYDIAEGSTSDSTVTNTVSHNYGFKESVQGSVEVGDYEEGEGTVFKDTVNATQDIVNNSGTQNGKFQSSNEAVSATTGWGDFISYTNTVINIWVYEVLGKKVCPAGKPDCQESDKRPLTVQFSGPTEVKSYGPLTATLVEWYQPPWEPGNIFSYPANFAQLQKAVDGDIDKLTKDTTYFTDSSSVTQSTQWREGATSSSTVGQNRTFSGDNTLSVAGKGGITDVVTLGFKVSFTAYGSDAFSSLTQSSASVSQSTGMSFYKPGSFANESLYSYAFTPYIFGTKPPVNYIDNIDPKTQLTTFGALRSAFVVDPTAPGLGSWWSRAYPLPDVALNHPARWTYSKALVPPSRKDIPLNCLALAAETSSEMDCLSLNQSSPGDPWSSAFHYMRGLFISSAAKPGAGPQREMAVEGEQLSLQARVYNYSTTPMPEDARVHVRFYGIPWNNSNHTSAGPAFLIGEDVLSPIPAFDSSSSDPNWVLANTTWNTAGLGDKDFTFFVVTWIQNADGSLGTEMPGHGLNAVPGTISSFSDAAKLEEIVRRQTASYSNNIGFYNKAFAVLSQSSATTIAAQRDVPDDVRLGQIKVDAHKVEQGQRVEVSALLRTRAKAVSGVQAVFYDGDPAQGGKVFDVERIAHIRARDAHELKVAFRANECGERRIFVTIGGGKPYEATDSSRPVTVKCAKPPQCETNCFRSPEYYSNNLWTGLPKGEVWIAGTPAPVNTKDVYAISQALKGGQSAQKTFNREYVAAQISMLGADTVGERRREMLNSTLACYGLSGANVVLTNGATVGAATSLRELLGQAEWAARAGRRADWEKLVGVLGYLNSDDPNGGCGTGGEVPPPLPPERTNQTSSKPSDSGR